MSQHGIGEIDVLRDRFMGKAADLIEPVAAYDKGCADTERAAPRILCRLEDIEKDTVDYQLNFDDSLKEPTVLPTRIPQLLVNGSSGIA